MTESFTPAGLDRLRAVLDRHVAHGEVPGLVWALARRGQVHVGTAGTVDGDAVPMRRDAIFRISSMTKPVVAVAAMMLVEDCLLRLDEPVDRLLPELADRRVLAPGATSLDDTVPAERPITVDDVLTFRLGLGMDFGAWGRQLTMPAAVELELGVGPPAPGAVPFGADEWIRRLGTLPLEHQPGARWLYHTGAEVLGVLVARAAGAPLPDVLRERIFEPLGMRDTGFWVPAASLDRLGPCWYIEPEGEQRAVYDPPEGQWSRAPQFPSGGGGLVSTVDDYLAFARMLLADGVHDGRRLLSRASVEAMTTDQLTDEQREASGPGAGGALGWGLGLGVHARRVGVGRTVGSYGWEGGMGSTWSNDPTEELVGILMTNQMWRTSTPAALYDDFWTCAYTALAD